MPSPSLPSVNKAALKESEFEWLFEKHVGKHIPESKPNCVSKKAALRVLCRDIEVVLSFRRTRASCNTFMLG
jgi:hypothetical protein